MSEKIDIIIDSSTDVEAGNEIVSASTDNNIDIEILEPDYNVTINKREYVITGDNLYIPKTYDESPQWLKDIIGTITDFSLSQKLTEIGALSNTLYGLIDELKVAKNTYTNSIITSAEIDERINARIETLNSSIASSDATIVDLIATKATPTEASSLALNVLTASINDGEISSLVSNLQNAISTSTSTLANNIDIVHAEMTGEFNANAEVINSMQAYVGIDEAGASTGTGVSAYLEGSNGVIGSADSKVANNVYVDGNGNSRSKFEYNSSLNIGGNSYNSGFGLSNSAGTGVGSEFWVDATRFKFTNSAKTGSKAPFTIDATGTTPEITFNGKVSFTNVTNTSGTGSNLLYNSAPKIGSETKGWYVWTNSGMAVNLSAGWDVWKPTGGASVAANIGGNPSIGSVFDVGQSSNFPVIAGSRYEASAYISAHRTNSYVFVVFYDAAGNYAGEASGNVINYAGSNALVNWGRSSVFTTAPGNAATATLIIRSSVTGANPYCFVTNAFAGVAEANQTIPSNWSEGTSAGATYTSELSNDAGFTTLGAVASQGYVLPAGVANAINTNTTTIDGAKITTGSIRAAQIAANSVTADKLIAGTNSSTVWTGGGLISQNFNGNPYGNIGSPSAGFRLSSGAAGTSTDPNIYGAYIQGSSVEVNSFKVRAEGYASNFGRLNLVSGYTAIVGRGYSTGFDARRVCSDSVSSIKLDCWARATGNWISAVLEYESNSNGNWILIADRGMSMYGYSEYAYLNFAEFFNPSLVPTTGYVHFRIRLTSGDSGSTSGVVVTLSNG